MDLDHTRWPSMVEDCICLAVTDAPLKFSGWLPRIAQAFHRDLTSGLRFGQPEHRPPALFLSPASTSSNSNRSRRTARFGRPFPPIS